MSRRSDSSASSSEENLPFRIRAGALHTVDILTGKTRSRWVVFQGTVRTANFQLKLYKSRSEKVLKSTFTLTKDTYVGTERGSLQSSRRAGRQNAPANSDYWAILLETDTIVFTTLESAAVDLHLWNSALKSYFSSESWLVTPIRGFIIPDYQLTVHVNRHALCLATLNPPRCIKRWRLSRIVECSNRAGIVCFTLDADGIDSGVFELRAETAAQARRIRVALEKVMAVDSDAGQIQPTTSGTGNTGPDFQPSLEREPPSPGQ
ncbi:uncharacterized protein [Diadema setosum]|uniref:uncharacterized protein n=1 Tax=Diadema setosum TaxID=31175 RepID=UPI003B3B7227